MRTFRCLAVVLFTAAVSQAVAASAAQPNADGVQVLLRRLEQVIQAGKPDGYTNLIADSANRDRANDFTLSEMAQPATRAVIQERDREPLRGSLPGDAFRLV